MLISLFILLGLLFIFLEFFLISAIFAILGSAFVLMSLILFFITYPIAWALGYLLVIVFAVIGICKSAIWWIKSSSKKGEFYLHNDQEGYKSSDFDQKLFGKEGVAVTELKTAGYILIDQKRYQAISESGFIVKNASIVVTGGKGAYLIVKEVSSG